MAKNVRLNLTEDEKIAQNMLGLNKEYANFNMSEGNIEDIIKREKVSKFNQEVDDYVNKFSSHVEKLKETQEIFAEDITNVEIKPMFSRIIFVPFENNPFQRIQQSESGLIIDTGGLTPEHFNTDKGEIEEDKPDIITGVVQEVGPEVKYIRPGDVIFYREPTAIPVPFYKQHFWSIAENQVIAIVNMGLENRFNEIKNDGRN